MFFTRTYRGYSLSPGVPDVTVENNLSRVITSISHALTSSTSRALTVSFRRLRFEFTFLYTKFLQIYMKLRASICLGWVFCLLFSPFQFGCCEALCLLSFSFPVCTWSTGWHCGFVTSPVFNYGRSSQYRSQARSYRWAVCVLYFLESRLLHNLLLYFCVTSLYIKI